MEPDILNLSRAPGLCRERVQMIGIVGWCLVCSEDGCQFMHAEDARLEDTRRALGDIDAHALVCLIGMP